MWHRVGLTILNVNRIQMYLKLSGEGRLLVWIINLLFLFQEIERRRAMMRNRAQDRKIEEMEVMEVVTAGRNVKEGESERERVDRLVVIGRQPLLERAGAFNRLCW